MPPESSLGLCGSGYSLTLTLSSHDSLVESDLFNNQHTIDGVEINGDICAGKHPKKFLVLR